MSIPVPSPRRMLRIAVLTAVFALAGLGSAVGRLAIGKDLPAPAQAPAVGTWFPAAERAAVALANSKLNEFLAGSVFLKGMEALEAAKGDAAVEVEARALAGRVSEMNAAARAARAPMYCFSVSKSGRVIAQSTPACDSIGTGSPVDRPKVLCYYHGHQYYSWQLCCYLLDDKYLYDK